MEKLTEKDCRALELIRRARLDENSNLQQWLKMGDLQLSDLEELRDHLKSKLDFYMKEIAKMEAAFEKLHVALSDSAEYANILQKLKNIQKKSNTVDLSSNALILSHTNRIRKQNNYLAKIKMCLKMYIELNDGLKKKVKQLKSVQEQVQNKFDESLIVMDDIKTTQKRIQRYENEITKLEKKHPWLKNGEYNLPGISKAINLLISLRNEKEELTKALSCYHGLKPDLQEASEQLNEIKEEYEKITEKLTK